MNDEQILARGGTQQDIEEYAEINGGVQQNKTDWESRMEEDWKKANILHMSQTDGTGILWVNLKDVKSFYKDFIRTLLAEQREEMFRKIKDYDFKEKHICGFNDGKQDCDCFIAGLNVALQIIKKHE